MLNVSAIVGHLRFSGEWAEARRSLGADASLQVVKTLAPRCPNYAVRARRQGGARLPGFRATILQSSVSVAVDSIGHLRRYIELLFGTSNSTGDNHADQG